MINSILDWLKLTDSNNELVQIAKGKYKHPESINEAYKKFKQEIRWSKKQ